ncbi:element excision factor XisH family protein [Iningainema tapete]|uniref:XisH family protein n=1 Tax=Iningainema tapete BLCC-T55 TaxID=2748662 RepID=A0A8J7C975_9CYAN|nr:element excision factor XisH family protein [Iningainema tapete]MBD2775621.1 XisH family protein [Iningainema tapete BLCC-T55]
MPAKDIFHDTVKNALVKDGWLVTDEQFLIRSGGVEIYIDIGAEKIIAAERGSEKIAVEVKSFLGYSTISEFHTAVGQFINYRSVLEEEQPERFLYLAIPLDVYESFFQLPFTQKIVQSNRISLIVYEPEVEVIVKWQK